MIFNSLNNKVASLLELKLALEFTTVTLLENFIKMVISYQYSKIFKTFNIILVQGGASICEMMFCSSLVATAGSGESTATSPRKVHIINTKVEQSQS